MTTNLLEAAIDSYKPNIDSILKYGKACGLEGEHLTLMAGTIAFHGADLCVMITGASQAGKTHLSKIVMSMVVPRAEDVDDIINNREMLLQEGGILSLEFGSKTAMAYNEAKLLEASGIYIPEYQKLADDNNKLVQEVLKAFGEGRSSYRDVTDVQKKRVVQQNMKRSNWWSNIATENPLKLDVETGNRVLPLSVDVSAEQTKRIMLHKARKEFVAGRQLTMMPEETLQFKHFMKKYRGTSDLVFENPFAEYIADNYLPNKYIKSRRAIDFYLAFNKAICKWHFLNGNRLLVDGHVLLNIEDIYQTEEIYGPVCRFDMLQLDPNSLEIFKIFERHQKNPGKGVIIHEDNRVMLDVNLIHKELSTSGGINLKINIVEQMLDELQECGYLEYSSGLKSRGCKYLLVDVDKPVHSVINYESIFSKGCEMVSKWLPEHYELWKNNQLINNELKVRHPFSGEFVNVKELKQVESIKLNHDVQPKIVQPKVTGLDVYV